VPSALDGTTRRVHAPAVRFVLGDTRMDQGVQPAGDRGWDWGAVVFGVVLLGIGGYWLLKDTLGVNLPDITWEAFWPVLLIGIGAVVLLRAASGNDRRSRRGR
jgi:hypothetical protein